MSANAKLFLKLVGTSSGEIPGECRVANFVGQIEIDDWSWAIKKETKPGGDGQSLPVPSAIAFSKILDKATTPMLAAMRAGEEMAVTITLEEVAAEQFGLIIKLDRARLLNYSMDVRDQDKGAVVEESWTLDYRDITFEHRSDSSAGTSTYKMRRPDWASTVPPSSAKGNKESEVAKLMADYAPGELDGVWERVKALIKKSKQAADEDKGSN